MSTARNPMTILREIDNVTAEKRLTPAYKEARLAQLNKELIEAQGQTSIDMPPQNPTAPTSTTSARGTK